MRVILFTGKGGVGKTSVAAATAVRCAQAGYRTVVMSTDPAHSLGDSFDLELGTSMTPIAENLWAHEVSALHEMQRHWARLHEYVVEVFATQGLDEVIAEEVANPPGMDEIASLMWIKHYLQRGEHDVLIVDCAPTGETLQLLTFPDAARWWLDKVYPWERRAMKMARPVNPWLNSQRTAGIQMSGGPMGSTDRKNVSKASKAAPGTPATTKPTPARMAWTRAVPKMP